MYTATTYSFLYSPAGDWTGTAKLTQTITFGSNPDEWQADAQVEFADVNGGVYLSGCSTAVGQRLS